MTKTRIYPGTQEVGASTLCSPHPPGAGPEDAATVQWMESPS